MVVVAKLASLRISEFTQNGVQNNNNNKNHPVRMLKREVIGYWPEWFELTGRLWKLK